MHSPSTGSVDNSGNAVARLPALLSRHMSQGLSARFNPASTARLISALAFA